jgi:valyl-tRNA synthetase
LRAERNIKPTEKLRPIIVTDKDREWFTSDAGTIGTLSGTYAPTVYGTNEYGPYEYKPGWWSGVSGSNVIHVELVNAADPFQQRASRTKELADAEAQIQRLQKLLGGDFAEKAPPLVVAKEREKLATYMETAEKLRAQLRQ